MVGVVTLRNFGGPEQLAYEEAEVASPAAGEVRIRQRAVGLNYTDVYSRMGRPGMQAPLILGAEGAGDVVALGAGVTAFKVGDRVAYTGGLGAYAEERNYPADRLVRIPDNMSYELAAAIMLKGLTAWYLIRKTYEVKPGTVLLLHAAAGGVGLILAQWAAHLGATVIGTVGSPEKARLAEAHGCRHTILYRDEDFVARVKEITKGALCHVVYDGVGKTTYPGSIECLRPRGMFVAFGNASGPIENFDFNALGPKGGLFATRPMLPWYVQTRDELLEGANELFRVVENGTVKVAINHRYALREVAQAHRDLEGRRTTGSAILLP
ncbi:MAG TPA: quinone oxidoreductase [Xanthobacteraceae bacterium]|nr:quinone oxidoreductase [Xanthobacteraceae bacterium]